jgi:hypothetical protein
MVYPYLVNNSGFPNTRQSLSRASAPLFLTRLSIDLRPVNTSAIWMKIRHSDQVSIDKTPRFQVLHMVVFTFSLSHW